MRLLLLIENVFSFSVTVHYEYTVRFCKRHTATTRIINAMHGDLFMLRLVNTVTERMSGLQEEKKLEAADWCPRLHTSEQGTEDLENYNLPATTTQVQLVGCSSLQTLVCTCSSRPRELHHTFVELRAS